MEEKYHFGHEEDLILEIKKINKYLCCALIIKKTKEVKEIFFYYAFLFFNKKAKKLEKCKSFIIIFHDKSNENVNLLGAWIE